MVEPRRALARTPRGQFRSRCATAASLRTLAHEAVVTEDGPRPPVQAEPTAPWCARVILTGRAAIVPFTTVLTGLERTITDMLCPWFGGAGWLDSHATVDACSNCLGVSMPRLLWRGCRLWKLSRSSTMALASATRVLSGAGSAARPAGATRTPRSWRCRSRPDRPMEGTRPQSWPAG